MKRRSKYNKYTKLHPLAKLIIVSGYDKQTIADYLGISHIALSRKLKDIDSFTLMEIRIISSLLPFSMAEIFCLATDYLTFNKDAKDKITMHVNSMLAKGSIDENLDYQYSVLSIPQKKRILLNENLVERGSVELATMSDFVKI